MSPDKSQNLKYHRKLGKYRNTGSRMINKKVLLMPLLEKKYGHCHNSKLSLNQ
jgi:hypothetical protein